MRPVGLGRELVDHRGVEGVLALLRTIDVAILPAAFAEEVACHPLPVRAAPAAAFRDQRRAPSAATGGPAVQARLAVRIPASVRLRRALPSAAWLRALLRLVAQDGLRHETRRELAACLLRLTADGPWEVHPLRRLKASAAGDGGRTAFCRRPSMGP